MTAQAAEQPQVAPGTVLGERFVIDEVIGEGGMGIVYRAHDKLADRPAAVKILKRNLVQSREFVTRFKREARAAARFRHDAAVRVLATGETEDRLPYIAMELVLGKSLADIVAKEAPLASGRACNIVAQLLRALGSAHKLGIVHRDMKPGNIRVVTDADGIERPKILDFGVAKFVRGDIGDVTGGFRTKTGVIVGTPKYMAPEQIRGDAIDGRADVYAVGAMFHELLTGKPPFEADDVFGFVALHLKQDVPPITQRFPELEVPHEVDEIVLRMLAKDPKERPEDAEVLGNEVERWAIEDPRAAQKAVEVRRGSTAVAAAGVAGAALAWILAPAVGPAAAAASLGLGLGAAFAARKFGRPSVYAYVKRVATVLAATTVLGILSLVIPGSPGFVVAASFVLVAMIVYAAFLLVWNARARVIRLVAAGVLAPALCTLIFPVEISLPERDPYYRNVLHTPEAALAVREGEAKHDTAIALFAFAALFGAASVALPRAGAARRT